ncbi:MAG: LuxR C-terminal-related transcriptional regulator [Phycisphaerales bacterium]|nr:LuxR C-terminal-related transcriptional regulator [Phycisphaerales bacterium]
MARQHKSDRVPIRETTPQRSVLTEAQWGSVAEALQLSKREVEVIRCIFNGSKELAIAQALKISQHTVHAHVQRIYNKLDVHGHEELIIRIFTTCLSLRP